MNSHIDNLISKTKELARKDDDEAALSLANELVEQYPNEMRVWALRGYLHRRNRKYAEAVADMTRAIEINNKGLANLSLEHELLKTVDLFFNRGTDRFALGDCQSAVDDFTKGLEFCDRYKNNDFRDTLHFWRAEALLRLGRKREAISDLTHVPDDFRFWTDKLRTKADLLADCNRLSG
jgi:tetratricopeptide (TPR) repeat protein